MKNVISCDQYTKQSLEELFELTDKIVMDPKNYSKALDGKIVAVMFYEPSTRTRLSFESAIQRLGAKMICTENAKVDSSAIKGESLTDTIRVIQGYSDAIVLRHGAVDSSEQAVRVADVPIINAGSGSGEHPTQALLDIYTIRQNRSSLNNLKVVIMGDLLYGRTIPSFIKLLSLYENIKIYGLSKKEFALSQKYIDYLNEKNIKYKVCSGFQDIPDDIDVFYHTRIQSERFEGDYGKEKYILNKEILKRFSSNAMILHPLPRNGEISVDIDDDPRTLFFKQAHNGVAVRMAILLQLLNN